MSDGPTPGVDYCTRCGELDGGKRQWMFHSDTIAKEFYCWRCLRIMRIYAWIGLSLLFVILGAAIGAVVWLTR
jgi:hypothetical protein